MVVLSYLLDFGLVQGDAAAMDLMDWWPRSGNDSFAMIFASRSLCSLFLFLLDGYHFERSLSFCICCGMV